MLFLLPLHKVVHLNIPFPGKYDTQKFKSIIIYLVELLVLKKRVHSGKQNIHRLIVEVQIEYTFMNLLLDGMVVFPSTL